jgi:hypothetical protein
MLLLYLILRLEFGAAVTAAAVIAAAVTAAAVNGAAIAVVAAAWWQCCLSM